MKSVVTSFAVLAALGCMSVLAGDTNTFAVSASDVTEAKVIFRSKVPTVLELSLTAEKAKELGGITEMNMGKTIQIQILGETVSTPRVMERIAGPNLQIATEDDAQALRLARGLTTRKNTTPNRVAPADR